MGGVQLDIAGSPRVALADEPGGGAGHEENRTTAAEGVEGAPEQGGGDCFVAGDARAEHDARRVVTGHEEAVESTGGVFERPDLPSANRVAEKEGVVRFAVKALPLEFKGGETACFRGVGDSPDTVGAGRGRGGEAANGNGKREVLVERVRHKSEP